MCNKNFKITRKKGKETSVSNRTGVCLTLNEQPIVDHCLDVGVEQPGDVMAHLQVGDVNE